MRLRAPSKPFLFLVLVGLISFCGGTHLYGLLDNNEGLYATIAREMWQTQDWIIPHLNGVPYLEKPPLLYWLTALSLKLFGNNAFAGHFIPSLSGLLVGLLLYGFTKRVTNNRPLAFLTSMLFMTSLGTIIMWRMLYCDGLLGLWVAGAMFALYLWHQEQRTHWQMIFYVCAALATLTKGLLAPATLGLAAWVYLLWETKSWRTLWRFISIPGILLYAGLTVPWHVLASLKDPGFAYFYFINEHVLRFLDQRIPRDYYHGPWYYYLLRLPLYLAPNMVLGLVSFAKTCRTPLTSLTRFSWSWFLVYFLFFSLSRAKANYYMMIAIPPLCLLVAHGITRAPTKLLEALSFIPYVLMTIFFGLLSIDWFLVPYSFPNPQIFMMLTAIVFLGDIFGMPRVAIDVLYRLSARLGLITLVWMAAFISYMPALDLIQSQRSVMEIAHQKCEGRLYFYKDFERFSSAAFYWGQPVPIINSVSNDLLYGQNLGDRPDLFITPKDLPTNTPFCILTLERNEHEPPLKNCDVIHRGTQSTVLLRCGQHPQR